MNYQVDLAYDGPDGHPGVDHVLVTEAMGGAGIRVTRPDELAGALAWAVATSEELSVPVLVEVMVEREANAAMGPAIDRVVEFEPVPTADAAIALSRSA